MKHYLASIFLLFFITVSFSAEIKIGIVDVNKILKEAPQTISANKKLEKEFGSRTEKLKAKIQILQADEKKYQKEVLTLSDDQKDKSEKSIQQKRIEVQRLERELREDMDLRRREEIGDLQEKINQTIDKIAVDEKYDLILYNGIAFASENVDITSRIIKSLGGTDSKTEDKKGSKEAPKPKKDAAE